MVTFRPGNLSPALILLPLLLIQACGTTAISESHLLQAQQPDGEIAYYRLTIEANAKLAKTAYRAGLYDAVALDAILSGVTPDDTLSVDAALERARVDAIKVLAKAYYQALQSDTPNAGYVPTSDTARVSGSTALSGTTATPNNTGHSGKPVPPGDAATLRTPPTTTTTPKPEKPPNLDNKAVGDTTPTPEKTPKVDKKPIGETTPRPEKTPKVDKKPIGETTPTPQKTPRVAKKPVAKMTADSGTTPTLDKKAVGDTTPTPENTPNVDKKPIRETTPQPEKTPTVGNTALVDKTPTPLRTPTVDTKPGTDKPTEPRLVYASENDRAKDIRAKKESLLAALEPVPRRQKFAIIFSALASVVEEAIAGVLEEQDTTKVIAAGLSAVKRDGYLQANADTAALGLSVTQLRKVSQALTALNPNDASFADDYRRLLAELASLRVP